MPTWRNIQLSGAKSIAWHNFAKENRLSQLFQIFLSTRDSRNSKLSVKPSLQNYDCKVCTTHGNLFNPLCNCIHLIYVHIIWRYTNIPDLVLIGTLECQHPESNILRQRPAVPTESEVRLEEILGKVVQQIGA